MDDDTPSCSKIIAINGSNIPCENPDINTIEIKMMNLPRSCTICVLLTKNNDRCKKA